MLVYGLRLFVALITFAVGVTSSWLLGSGQSCRAHRGVVTYSHDYTVTTRTEAQLIHVLPKRECKMALSPQVVEGGILNAKAVSRPAPAFSLAGEAGPVTGTVSVKVEVDEGGVVTRAEAVSGPGIYRRAAEEAARAARFAPTRLAGQPVKVTGHLTYGFYDK